ncbi:hypothetical protein PsorP6_012897 [Peronosclerospora sorghi]|uniref:Uncharacterized protein n=1 Tax=Peronosclerospora sorghi TaxID=230839 RepID=A0ACC0WJ62_9STRA|nr:hypothetical protein PsorP6_012897 [Peronosclerospora sorghi]
MVTFLLIALAILTSVRMKEDVTIDVDGDLVIEEEETPADSAEAVPEQEIDPPQPSEAIENILSKKSAMCLKEVRDSAMEYSKMSDRFREEVARRIRRYLARLDKEVKGETEKKKAKDKIPEKKNVEVEESRSMRVLSASRLRRKR